MTPEAKSSPLLTDSSSPPDIAAAPLNAVPSGTSPVPDLLSEILGETPPTAYALLARAGRDAVEVLVGNVVDVDLLADIPLFDESGSAQEVLALVPFRQVAERGYDYRDDGAPLRCLQVSRREELPLADVVERLPGLLPTVTGQGFDVSDVDYIETVRDVIHHEIGSGQGANFVIRRDYLAQADSTGADLATALLRRLLETESGAYWTFAVVTPGVTLVGASPERHVSVKDGVATMNPISGTFRHPASGVDPVEFGKFLMDTKEVEELFMVVDEELKMMSAVCTEGGVIEGPFLKQMSRVTHTEYLLSGHTTLDVRDVLRETMFAPTVTGSPMQNACTVITRHERNGRGYYSGVAALMSPEADGGHSLDAPILIRTAQIGDGGSIRVSAGATLVRHSSPEGEVAETAGKAAGLLGALGLESAFAAGFGAGEPLAGRVAGEPLAGRVARNERIETPALVSAVPGSRSVAGAPTRPPEPALVSAVPGSRSVAGAPTRPPEPAPAILADSPAIQTALAARNTMLAPFWLSSQSPKPVPGLAGKTTVIVDAEDRFTTMLAHQLRHLGMNVTVVHWSEVGSDGSLPPALIDRLGGVDLVVSGPGPGDPQSMDDPRIARVRAAVRRRLSESAPLVAVCLSHQVLAHDLGLALARLDHPRQGVQLTIDFFGTQARLGFYNTFTVRLASADGEVTEALPPGVTAAVDESSGDVFALRGPHFATVQGHAESILSADGIGVLQDLAEHALAD